MANEDTDGTIRPEVLERIQRENAELKAQIERDVESVRQRIGPIGPGRHQHLESTNA